MREHKLYFRGVRDLVILSPKVIEKLIPEICDQKELCLTIDVNDILPEGYIEYLTTIISCNRFINREFQFEYIRDNPLFKEQIYQIINEQLKRLCIDEVNCFEKLGLVDTSGEAGLDIVCNELFFWACKDARSTFIYEYQDGRRETLKIECSMDS